ncbi:MAG: MauE/DoxX family redox-associated membrane protein [Syntrophobacteraceae bacterium]
MEEKTSRRIRGYFQREPLLLPARLALGLIFIIAGIDKVLHPDAFAKIIYNYQILPDSLINISAIVLPWVELILGGLIIAGLCMPGAVLLAEFLLVIFWSVLVFNVARGVDVHCGCFSTSVRGEPKTLWYVVRDTAFMVLGGYVLFRTIVKPGAHKS